MGSLSSTQKWTTVCILPQIALQKEVFRRRFFFYSLLVASSCSCILCGCQGRKQFCSMASLQSHIVLSALFCVLYRSFKPPFKYNLKYSCIISCHVFLVHSLHPSDFFMEKKQTLILMGFEKKIQFFGNCR